MRNKFSFLLFFVIALFCTALSISAQDFYGTEDLKIFRAGRDAEMRNKEETPLREEDIAAFTGLKYFETDKKFRLKAKLVKEQNEQKINFETSSGRVKTYLRYGRIEFKLDNKRYTLIAFQAQPGPPPAMPDTYDDLLFIPFRDMTSGKDTYGSGRYLSIWIPRGTDKVLLDFNMAYNPSCAYGTSRFSCPIPPRENRLAVEIKAGEKNYKTED